MECGCWGTASYATSVEVPLPRDLNVCALRCGAPPLRAANQDSALHHTLGSQTWPKE